MLSYKWKCGVDANFIVNYLAYHYSEKKSILPIKYSLTIIHSPIKIRL